MGNSGSNTVEWKGWLVKDSKKEDFSLPHMVCDTLGRLSGEGKDKVGKYSVFGFVSEQGVFTFQKVYDKKKYNTPANPVYKGKFQGGFLSGTYSAPGVMDNFFLKMTNAIFFSGHYQRSDIPYPLSATMYLQVSQKIGIFGLGCDHNGFYVAKGEKLKTDKEAKKGKFKKYFFTVSYLNKFQIQHHARGREPIKGTQSLSGFWLNDSMGLRGTFELTEVKPHKNKDGKEMAQAEFAVLTPVERGRKQLLHSSMFGCKSFNNQAYKNYQPLPQSDNFKAPQAYVAPAQPQVGNGNFSLAENNQEQDQNPFSFSMQQPQINNGNYNYNGQTQNTPIAYGMKPSNGVNFGATSPYAPPPQITNINIKQDAKNDPKNKGGYY
eukprot:TRINITY_DN13543_c0_g1_i3.p2 TRINITY_DN13543_c0_g1~~TRINITY_DN13543_c0_g1_i3.p2  ORF type:complete len:378 (+),score=58.20 TRINITY_DN13543_c0_g1_i3:12-1145(+)